jgi:hypothetical protein
MKIAVVHISDVVMSDRSIRFDYLSSSRNCGPGISLEKGRTLIRDLLKLRYQFPRTDLWYIRMIGAMSIERMALLAFSGQTGGAMSDFVLHVVRPPDFKRTTLYSHDRICIKSSSFRSNLMAEKVSAWTPLQTADHCNQLGPYLQSVLVQ